MPSPSSQLYHVVFVQLQFSLNLRVGSSSLVCHHFHAPHYMLMGCLDVLCRHNNVPYITLLLRGIHLFVLVHVYEFAKRDCGVVER